jgi:hypothetical protein
MNEKRVSPDPAAQIQSWPWRRRSHRSPALARLRQARGYLWLLVMVVTDHPLNAKPVGKHAKVRPPKSLFEGHGYLPAG